MSVDGGASDVVVGRRSWSIIVGDCADVLAAMPESCVAHVITDPPYEAKAHAMQLRLRKGGGADAKALPFAPISTDLRARFGLEAGRVAKRWVLAFCQVEATQLWRSSFEAGGLRYRRTCVWVKPDGMPQLTGDRPGMGYEAIVACHARGRSRWNGGGRCGVFYHATRNSSLGFADGQHPTAKPLSLMLELVGLFTDPGDVILDPFAGSGTTGVAALRLGRRFIGVELDAKYAELARERLRAEEAGTTPMAAKAGQLGMFERKAG